MVMRRLYQCREINSFLTFLVSSGGQRQKLAESPSLRGGVSFDKPKKIGKCRFYPVQMTKIDGMVTARGM